MVSTDNTQRLHQVSVHPAEGDASETVRQDRLNYSERRLKINISLINIILYYPCPALSALAPSPC